MSQVKLFFRSQIRFTESHLNANKQILRNKTKPNPVFPSTNFNEILGLDSEDS